MFSNAVLKSKTVVFQNKNTTALKVVDRNIDLVPKGSGYGVKSGEILVKIHSAAFNAVEPVLKGYTSPWMNYFQSDFGLCNDYSGTVVDIGEEAAAKFGLKVGDNVCGYTFVVFYSRTLTEYVKLSLAKESRWCIVKKPQSLTLNEAATFGVVYTTAQTYIKAAKLSPDSKVLVNGGATSVGRYLLSLLKEDANVKEVVAIASGKSTPLVLELGADSVIDYTKTNNITKSVVEKTTDGSFNVIIDCIGSAPLIRDKAQYLKKKGKYLVMANGNKVSGGAKGFNYYAFKSIIASLIHLSSIKTAYLPATMGEGFDVVGELFDSGKIRPFVDSVYRFDQYQEAYDVVAGNKNSGKIVVQVEDGE